MFFLSLFSHWLFNMFSMISLYFSCFRFLKIMLQTSIFTWFYAHPHFAVTMYLNHLFFYCSSWFSPNFQTFFHSKSMKNMVQQPFLEKELFLHLFFRFFHDFGLPWGTPWGPFFRYFPSKSHGSPGGNRSRRVLCEFSCFFDAFGIPWSHLGTIWAPF